jgi:hypothetical protein
MSETSVKESSKTIVKTVIKFLPFMCENAPSFKDMDTVLSLLPPEGIQHRQREIWKMAPKKDEKNNVMRDANGHMIMVKVVTRTSKNVTVKNVNGLCSFIGNGIVEPMDYTDVKEVIALLKK